VVKLILDLRLLEPEGRFDLVVVRAQYVNRLQHSAGDALQPGRDVTQGVVVNVLLFLVRLNMSLLVHHPYRQF
jgi:hypothetical protein